MGSELGDFIGKALIRIIKKQDGAEAVEEIRKYFRTTPWPMGASKETTLKFINKLINCENLDENPFTQLMDIMSGIEYKPKRTKEQLKQLRDIVSIINAARMENGCKHRKLGIAPFMHGGGFLPTFALPEVICLECGLNVTIPKQYNVPGDKMAKSLGIEMTKDEFNKMQEWAMKCLKWDPNTKKHISSSRDILADPVKAYKRSAFKWEQPIPFKIVDRKKFESFSGR